MKIELQGRKLEFDGNDPIDISIPMRFNGPQPNAYGVAEAASQPCEYGDLVGDTRRGGSCNFEQVTLIPHCNGTHTECVGHITNDRLAIRDRLKDVFISAVLISITPEDLADSKDLIISRDSIANSVARNESLAPLALIIRTLPNDADKLVRSYDVEKQPPYFTQEAMQYIVGYGFKHLLVDMPSIDRLYDEGRLANHRTFWNVAPGSFETNTNTRNDSTITELIYVPNDVEDGEYLVNLQIAPFESDASPSRPVLFRLK